MKTIFILSLFTLFYIYLGYPFVLFLFSLVRPKKVVKNPYEPAVSILIAAYNEERNIERTLRNKLELEYPKEKLEIIVISDGSTDKTEEIIKRFEHDGVHLLQQIPRKGKTAALNMAVQKAKGEILVFSDANSIYANDALKHLVNNFSDPTVGYVTGKMIYTNPEGSVIGDGCSTYMKYENYLRTLETKVNSLVGVDGGIDAVRKDLYQPMNPDQLPDFVLPLKVVAQGSRVVYEPNALLREPSLASSEDEYRMRVRVSLRALWAMRDMRHLLNVQTYPLFSWELLSHKVLRYLAFVFLIGLYVSNAYLSSGPFFYKTCFVLQNLFYLSALISLILERKGKKTKIFYIPYYFSLINTASAHAVVKFLFGHKQTLWTPRKG